METDGIIVLSQELCGFFLVSVWLKFLESLSGQIIEAGKVDAEEPGPVFNSHVNGTVPSFNKPKLAFWGFIRSVPLQKLEKRERDFFQVMVIILIRGLSTYRFWEMKTRRASGRQDVSVDWPDRCGGRGRRRPIRQAQINQKVLIIFIFHLWLLCAPHWCPWSAVTLSQSPLCPSLPALVAPLTVPLPICDWNRGEGVASCLVCRHVCGGILELVLVLYILYLCLGLTGHLWQLVKSWRVLEKSPRNRQTLCHNTAGRFSVQFLQRCAMSVWGENMVQWYFEKYSFI